MFCLLSRGTEGKTVGGHGAARGCFPVHLLLLVSPLAPSSIHVLARPAIGSVLTCTALPKWPADMDGLKALSLSWLHILGSSSTDIPSRATTRVRAHSRGKERVLGLKTHTLLTKSVHQHPVTPYVTAVVFPTKKLKQRQRQLLCKHNG